MKHNPISQSGLNKNNMVRLLLPVAAVILLLAFAAWLYRPHWFGLGGIKLLWPLNSVAAAMGCFVLTRRWISSFDASLLAAVIYGFGPFGLSFVSYHPLAGLSYVAVPWLLCPAVYYQPGQTSTISKTLITSLLSLLPFAAIAGLFWLAAHYWAGPLYMMPKNKVLEPTDLWGMITPMLFTSNHFAIGFYHMPLICMLMGLFVFALSGKETLLVPVLGAVVLSLLSPICNVTPIVWLSFAALFLSICSALGLQALALAGKADRFWVLACVAASLLLAGCNYLMAGHSSQQADYHQAAILFLASAAATGVIFLLTQFNLKLTLFRWAVLFGVCVYDLWMTAPRLVDSLF
jgi:hypothetical protein